jgi:hypothetical protein
MISARQIARAYDLAIAALWRGEGSEHPLIAWLGAYRTVEAPPEPRLAPEAVSLLGGGGAGIRWYATPTAVLGFANGHPAVCYRVPVNADLPPFGPAAVAEPVVPVTSGTAAL